MIVNVVVKANSKKEYVDFNEGIYTVYTKAPARDNMANISVICLLSEYLNIPKGSIRIKRGIKSSRKILEVEQKQSSSD